MQTNHPGLVSFFRATCRRNSEALFPEVSSVHLNQTLKGITGQLLTAKDFRTWGGTRSAFEFLAEKRSPRPAAVKEAVKYAAHELGNTPAVAGAHYIHPHMLEAFEDRRYGRYFRPPFSPSGALSGPEVSLLRLLRRLVKERFPYA